MIEVGHSLSSGSSVTIMIFVFAVLTPSRFLKIRLRSGPLSLTIKYTHRLFGPAAHRHSRPGAVERRRPTRPAGPPYPCQTSPFRRPAARWAGSAPRRAARRCKSTQARVRRFRPASSARPRAGPAAGRTALPGRSRSWRPKTPFVRRPLVGNRSSEAGWLASGTSRIMRLHIVM